MVGISFDTSNIHAFVFLLNVTLLISRPASLVPTILPLVKSIPYFNKLFSLYLYFIPLESDNTIEEAGVSLYVRTVSLLTIFSGLAFVPPVSTHATFISMSSSFWNK